MPDIDIIRRIRFRDTIPASGDEGARIDDRIQEILLVGQGRREGDRDGIGLLLTGAD